MMFKQLKNNYEKLIFLGCFLYFFSKSLYFILDIPLGLPPDELFHFKQIILFYVHQGFLISPEDLNAYQGTQSRNFFFYHFLLGNLLHLNSFINWEPVFYLRFLNLLLSLLYLVIFFRFAKLVLKDRLLISFAFILHTNILMFTFLSSSMNYDNLVNLLSICSAYFLFKAIIDDKKYYLFHFVIFILLGTLTKRTFLPIALILLVIGFIEYRSYFLKGLIAKLKQPLGDIKPTYIAATLIIAILIGTNIAVHAPVIFEYGTLTPTCNDIYSYEKCMRENPVFAKYSTLKNKVKGYQVPPDPIRYFFIWSDYMIEKTLGIFAYSSFYQGNLILGITELILIVSVFVGLRTIEFNNRVSLYLISVVVIYTAILIYFASYKGYLTTGLFPRYSFIGVQGRYIFPVISIMIILFAKYILNVKSRAIKVGVFLSISLFFSYIAFPMYYFTANEKKLVSNKQLQMHHIQSLNHSQIFLQ